MLRGIINQGIIHFAGITNKSVANPGFTEWMHCFPTYFDSETCAKIYGLVEKAIAAVKINHCAFGNGNRLGSCQYKNSTWPSIELKLLNNQYACERNLFAKKNGTILEWKYTEEVFNQSGVRDFKILRHEGEFVKVPPDGYDNLLCAVITGEILSIKQRNWQKMP
ncbi:hypothetical protein [Legionella bozemanae]|uniref:hypothetical protein n=1 Tax=Legionella bozemanae TaxID=447 RepID=UPI00104136B5|nr:hypothetical protein [Legionella bozemanae]